MRIAATSFACTLTLMSAYALYSETAANRRLEAQVQAAERQRERLEHDITVLRAERAHLARPSRIEPAAKALGMRTPEARDYVELNSLLAPSASSPGSGRR